jgi:hypothetical protein
LAGRSGVQLWAYTIFVPTAKFVKRYCLQLGFLDGWRGLFMAFAAAGSEFLAGVFALSERETVGGQ